MISSMAHERCPQCGEGALGSRVKTFSPDDECIEVKIELLRCSKFCGYRGQRDITQSVMSPAAIYQAIKNYVAA